MGTTPEKHLITVRANNHATDPVIHCHCKQFQQRTWRYKTMSELNEIKKEFEALKKRNAPPAEFEALLKRNARHRAGLFKKLESAVKGESNE